LRWQLRSCDEAAVAPLARDLVACGAVEPRAARLLARLLVARGVQATEDALHYLNPALSDLHSPYLLAGMHAAVDRLCAAIARKEKILIYGDYDVDGTTSVVILKTAIELCGGVADFHVPHRVREGYGMRDEIIERAAADGVHLIVSVDTGIRAFAAAETAERLGLDLIVTDHHLPEAGTLPRAIAVINPNRDDCAYPCKALCGAGVAFKIVQALLEKYGRQSLLPSFMKMVAIATIADAVPLTGENRVIARLGLDGLRDPRNPGLKALVEVAGVDLSRRLTSTDVAFKIAPRLNAAGRMDVARDVVELFSTRDAARAQELANRLHQLNSDRQQEEARILAEITDQVEREPALRDAYCIVLAGDAWHRGVIGIAATRVVERYGRPALVIARDEAGQAHGSGRSIPAFHLLAALESCGNLFTRFGGHAHAVGFSLPSDRVSELATAIDVFARVRLRSEDFDPVLDCECELALGDLTPDLYATLRRLEPFGAGNPEPRFVARAAPLLAPMKVIKDAHAKFKLGAPVPGRSFLRSIDAIGWRMAEQLAPAPQAGDAVDIAFTLDMNDHPEFGGLQLVLADVPRVSVAAEATSASSA
jgi:single-stranded-DNA-specific exonuclease